jgi:hypothetical protein
MLIYVDMIYDMKYRTRNYFGASFRSQLDVPGPERRNGGGIPTPSMWGLAMTPWPYKVEIASGELT